MQRELKQIEKLFRKLGSAPCSYFPQRGQTLDVPSKHGVYVILDPTSTPVHVGRTVKGKKGLIQRLNNHLHGSSSFTDSYLDGKGSKLRGKYRFKYILVSNPRTRALLEAFAVGRLCPKHLGHGALLNS